MSGYFPDEDGWESGRPMPPCPACGADELAFEVRLEAKAVGTFSLAGQVVKFPVSEVTWLVCRGCRVEARGHI